MPVLFCLGIQPNCLNVVSYSESGLLQAKGFALSPRARRSCDFYPLWFHVAVVPAPIVFSNNKPVRLSTRRVAMHGPIGGSGPMAFLDCPRGHRVPRRLACF